MVKEIVIHHKTHGTKIVLIDDEDFPRVSRYRWKIMKNIYSGIFYARRNIWGAGRGQVILHRYILGLRFGDNKVVDHINGDGLDNRRSNIRVVTRRENMRNKRVK